MNSQFLIPAAREFEEAIDWYGTRSLRAADGFRKVVRTAINRAMNSPTSAGFLVGKRTRKIMLEPYDYGLIYFAYGESIYVVAVAHNKRGPGYWKQRIARP